MQYPPEFPDPQLRYALSNWTAEEAAEHFGEGVRNPSRTEGLHALRGMFPETWHLLVRTWTSKLSRARKVPVRALLTTDFSEPAMPRHADDYERACRYRRCARRLIESVGQRPLAWFHEERLEELRVELVDTGCSASVAARTVSYLRVLLRRWCRWHRKAPKVETNPAGPRRRIGSRQRRKVAGPQQIARLLPALKRELRAMVALAGGGLLQSEILALRHEDILIEHRAVCVHSGGIRGRGGEPCDRVEYLPAWAWELLLASMPRVGRGMGLLFPPRGGGDTPRKSAARSLRRACDGAVGKSNGVTFAEIRNLWQAVVRQAGLPRAAIRQTWRRSDFGRRGAPWMQDLRELMGCWVELCQPPVDLAMARATRRSPKECGPLDSERSFGVARPATAPLPSSCRVAEFRRPAPVAAVAAEVGAGQGRAERRTTARAVVGVPAVGRTSGARATGLVNHRGPERPWAQREVAPRLLPRHVGHLTTPPARIELTDRDVDRIAERVAGRLKKSMGDIVPASQHDRSGPAIDAATLRRELQRAVVGLQRSNEAHAQAFIGGLVTGAGAMWTMSNPSKVREAVERIAEVFDPEGTDETLQLGATSDDSTVAWQPPLDDDGRPPPWWPWPS